MKSRRSYSNQRSQRPAPVWQVCLCWLLCFCVWRGPVPIVHDHALDLQTLGNNSQLAAHAIVHHADSLGDAGTGLHLHFILLNECSSSLLLTTDASSVQGETNLGCCEGFAADCNLKGEQQEREVMELNCALAKVSFGDLPPVFEDVCYSSAADESFLQTQLSGAPACAVLCVFLC